MQVEVGSDDTASSATHMLVDSSNTSLADDNPDTTDNKYLPIYSNLTGTVF